MSRFGLALALVASLTTSAFARGSLAPAPSAPANFARPPDPTLRPETPVEVVPTRAIVRAKLVAARAANLARFRAYQRKGVFPNNLYADRKLNVWIDEAGNLCAAATIIQMSGHAALVARTGERNNFIRLADVTDGPLLDWMLTSGLTQAELVAIQAPMVPVTRFRGEPGQPVLVDARLRRLENRRLVAKYREVDAQIVKHGRTSLDVAVDRVMARADLAQQLVASR